MGRQQSLSEGSGTPAFLPYSPVASPAASPRAVASDHQPSAAQPPARTGAGGRRSVPRTRQRVPGRLFLGSQAASGG